MSKVAHVIKEKSRTGDVAISENLNFDGLLLSSPVLNGLKNAGFERPSPIQLKAIPLGRCGLDLIVQAKSGTGKTCVFSVIALESVLTDTASTQVLVLAPTREIAVQIWEVINSIGSAKKGLECHTFIGGMPLSEDRMKLKKCHIAVGSPGRVKQLIESGALQTSSVRLFVLDEADKLLEEGFQEQINWIYSTLPDNKQMLALSATYPEYLAQHLTAYMRNPTFLRLNISDPALLGIRQFYASVPHHPLSHVVFDDKVKVLKTLLSSISFQQCLIFSNLQTRAQNLADQLSSQGWPTACIAGCLDQKERNDAMARLKSYKCRILISTDLTSRGIDADKVNLVINLDIPKDHETYLHRIGRAGRFGSFGIAVSLISEGQEKLDLNALEKRCNTQVHPLPDPIPSDLARPDTPIFLDDVVSSEVIDTSNRTTINTSHDNQSYRTNITDKNTNNLPTNGTDKNNHTDSNNTGKDNSNQRDCIDKNNSNQRNGKDKNNSNSTDEYNIYSSLSNTGDIKNTVKDDLNLVSVANETENRDRDSYSEENLIPELQHTESLAGRAESRQGICNGNSDGDGISKLNGINKQKSISDKKSTGSDLRHLVNSVKSESTDLESDRNIDSVTCEDKSENENTFCKNFNERFNICTVSNKENKECLPTATESAASIETVVSEEKKKEHIAKIHDLELPLGSEKLPSLARFKGDTEPMDLTAIFKQTVGHNKISGPHTYSSALQSLKAFRENRSGSNSETVNFKFSDITPSEDYEVLKRNIAKVQETLLNLNVKLSKSKGLPENMVLTGKTASIYNDKKGLDCDEQLRQTTSPLQKDVDSVAESDVIFKAPEQLVSVERICNARVAKETDKSNGALTKQKQATSKLRQVEYPVAKSNDKKTKVNYKGKFANYKGKFAIAHILQQEVEASLDSTVPEDNKKTVKAAVNNTKEIVDVPKESFRGELEVDIGSVNTRNSSPVEETDSSISKESSTDESSTESDSDENKSELLEETIIEDHSEVLHETSDSCSKTKSRQNSGKMKVENRGKNQGIETSYCRKKERDQAAGKYHTKKNPEHRGNDYKRSWDHWYQQYVAWHQCMYQSVDRSGAPPFNYWTPWQPQAHHNQYYPYYPYTAPEIQSGQNSFPGHANPPQPVGPTMDCTFAFQQQYIRDMCQGLRKNKTSSSKSRKKSKQNY